MVKGTMMRNWKLRSSVIVLAAVMMASSGCGKKNNDTASLPQLPSQTQTQEQTIEQTIPVTTEEEAIQVCENFKKKNEKIYSFLFSELSVE